ncbi:MAG: hypothetical protein OHK0017_06100 [Patescibacteria group bacterium]
MTAATGEQIHSPSSKRKGYWTDQSQSLTSGNAWQQLEQAFVRRREIQNQLNGNNSPEQKAYLEVSLADVNKILNFYWMIMNSSVQHENQAKLWQQRYAQLLNEHNNLKAVTGNNRKSPIQAAYGLNNQEFFEQAEQGSISKQEFTELVDRLRGVGSPDSTKGYFKSAMDYILKDRLPKLFSTRLWLVLGGGGYIIQDYSSISNLVKVGLVAGLIAVYVVSEMYVKRSKYLYKSVK